MCAPCNIWCTRYQHTTAYNFRCCFRLPHDDPVRTVTYWEFVILNNGKKNIQCISLVVEYINWWKLSNHRHTNSSWFLTTNLSSAARWNSDDTLPCFCINPNSRYASPLGTLLLVFGTDFNASSDTSGPLLLFPSMSGDYNGYRILQPGTFTHFSICTTYFVLCIIIIIIIIIFIIIIIITTISNHKCLIQLYMQQHALFTIILSF